MDFTEISGKYKPIKDFPDYYITEHGEIYSKRLRGAEKEPRLRLLKPKNPGRKDKYLNIILCNDYGQFTKSIHRLVAEHFVQGYFDGAVVNHIDGNNRNNDASNLEWVTQKDNIHKSYATSNIHAKRNFLIWDLYSPNNEHIETFTNHQSIYDYIQENNLDTSASQLIKKRFSRGYRLIVSEPQNKHCNDYPQGVAYR